MALTHDVHTTRYGTPDGHQETAWPLAANVTVYSGAVALLDGATGLLKSAATTSSTDIVLGIIDAPSGGTAVQTGPGITGGSTDGAVWVNVQTGSFFLQSGTGADQLSETTAGKTCYYGGENSSGGLACATSGSGTRPQLGIQFAQDPGIAGGCTPGANYWPIKFSTVGGP